MSDENIEEMYEKILSTDSYYQMNSQRTQSEKLTTSIKSQYLGTYQNFMEMAINLPSETQMQQKLRQRQIFINKEKNTTDKLQFQVQHEANNFEYVIIKVKLSIFQLKLTILNVKGKNPLLSRNQSSRGNYGYVYYFSFLKTATAFKILRLQTNQLTNIIHKAIKQYSILKICSTFQCGPFLDTSLGFQLVVFDDSVMYSMQQCSLVDSANPQSIQRLKSSLQLMHQYHIIHFDIKTQNIMYSPYYNKMVFIDFGFSEIIKQSLGEKSFIEFKGSPAFCSEQMTRLLGSIEEATPVDVYYNDMIGLKISIVQIKFQVSCEKNDKGSQFICLVDEQLQMQFAIHLLKQNVFRKKEEGIIRLLKYKQCLLLRKKGYFIMQIFQPSSFFLFKNIYEEIRLDIHKFVEAQIIQGYFRMNQAAYTFRNTKREDKGQSFEKRLNVNQEDTQLITCDKYKEFLTLQKVFEDQSLTEQSYHILIQLLRFDVKNNQLGQKFLFANKFNRVHKVQPQLDIASIKTTFSILFNYCLKPPYTIWKKQHIFVILNQLLMLDTNLKPHLQQLFTALTRMTLTLLDSVKCSIQLQKILFMLSFKHLSEHQCMKEEIPKKIHLFAKRLLEENVCPERVQQQSSLMCVILAFNKQLIQKKRVMSQSGYRKIIDSINYIKDKQLKDYLLQYFTLKYIEIIFLDWQHGSAYDILHYLKNLGLVKILQKNKDRFHYSAFHISRTLIFINNYKQLNHLYTNLINCINCVEISSKYKFQMSNFLYSEEANQQKLRKYSLQLLDSPSSLFNVKNSTQLSQIAQKIEKCQKFAESYPQILEKFWFSFLDCEPTILDEQILSLRQLENIMLKYRMALFFLNFSPHFAQQLVTERITQIRQKMIQNEGINQYKYIFYQFQHEAYLSAYHSVNRQYDMLIVSYTTLYNISNFLNNQKSQFYFLKVIILSAVSIKNHQLLRQFIFKFYNIAKSLTSVTRYFQEKEKIFIAITLCSLYQNNDYRQFYSFLIIISQFLTNFPTEENINHLYQNLEKLMRNEKYLALLSYDRLSKVINHNYWLNRYFVIYFLYSLRFSKKEERQDHMKAIFLKLAENIDYLKFCAKQIIMRQSIGFVIGYFKNNDRKKNNLICKWGYRFLPKEKLKKYYIKKVSGSRFERSFEEKINSGLLA